MKQFKKRGNDAPPVYVRDIVDILRQVGEALKYLHESRDAAGNEISHGDIAARNVLLTSTKLQFVIFIRFFSYANLYLDAYCFIKKIFPSL